jgi:hypothetical protein
MVAGKEISPKDAAATERLHRYWAHGEGAAKIMWGVPGDFARCVRHLRKYITDPEGYCAKMHKDVTGFVPGQAPAERGHKDKGKGRRG